VKKKNKYFDIYGPVFWPAAGIITLFITVTLLIGEPMENVFSNIQNGISDYFGWFFVLAVNIFLGFIIFLAFSKFGKIRLGGPGARPEFNLTSWFAMLFSAGMGIGILFWSVAEPIFHYIAPPSGEAETIEAARRSMESTFLHWGLHAWGIYALVALSLAFFAFNKKLPLAIRSIFHPLLGKRINGPIGIIIDILAVVATLFGLATSLGFGVQQVSAGLDHVFGFNDSVRLQVILIIIITLGATASVVSGLEKGVKMLSTVNIYIAAIFLLFVLIIGPTLFILDTYVQNIGEYLQNLLARSFWTESYQQSDWQNSWTVFYWSWWISWSPFVGMFIARISKGRTVREFVAGVLLVPTLITFLWLSAFGGSAIYLEMNNIGESISEAVNDNVATAIYQLLEHFPISAVTSVVAIVLVTSFFVTSSDSGSLVVDAFTSGGKLDSPVGQRIFWAGTEGAVAAVLLIGGGLGALQTASIMTGLPFTLILLVMCYSLYQGLNKEHITESKEREKVNLESYKKLIGRAIERESSRKKDKE
jgi:choline/glycine/proline betaine transport protein